MSSDEKAGGVFGIVLCFALSLLCIQSCMQSHTGEFPDQDILRIGRKHFVEIHTEPSAVKILRDAVIRPGRKGGEFGYWAQYQRLTADGEWIEEEHYDE